MEKKIIEEFKVKYRKFSEISARNERTNFMVLVSMTIIEVMLLFVYAMMQLDHKGSPIVAFPMIIFMLAGLILNFTMYFKEKGSARMRYIAMAPFLLGYFWVSVFAQHSTVTSLLYIIPVVLCYVSFYDKKCSKILAVSGIGCVILRVVMLLITTKTLTDDQIVISFITIMSLVYFNYETKVVKAFDHDTIHTMQDEQKLQKIILNDIMATIESTQEQIANVVSLMEALSTSTEGVSVSLQEITVGTQSTAESIQEQTLMTENIQNAVEAADRNAQAMAGEAETSAQSMEESNERMKEMQLQSEQIEASGKDVAAAMETLRAKAAEVTGITEVIFSISSQTNLLALNASIESARAGEAGRGFSVVAEQIRQLAEQTKNSTEQIAQIAKQLNDEAENATNMVEKTLAATNAQKQLIIQNVETFGEVKDRADSTAQKAHELNEQIGKLLVANNKIVESIAQLSAVSEEVTASTYQASEVSESNLQELKNAAEKINAVKDTVMELKKYNDSTKH